MLQTSVIISFFLGLAPCNIDIGVHSSKTVKFTLTWSYSLIGCVYSISLVMFFLGINIVAVPNLYEIPYPNDSVTSMMIIVVLSVQTNIIVVTIIMFYLLFQRHIIAIGNRLSEFDQKYGDTWLGVCDKTLGDFVKFMAIVMQLFLWIAFFVTSVMAGDTLFFVASGFGIIFCSWFLLQYSLINIIIRDRFKGLNDAISRCSVSEGNSFYIGSSSNNQLTVEKFITFTRARAMIYNISLQVSQFYSFPVLLVIFHCSCSSVSSCYFFLMTLMESKSSSPVILSVNSSFWTFMELYPIVILSVSVAMFHEEAKRTADIVYHIIVMCPPDADVVYQLNNFAIELLHKNVQFTACGIFSLDCTLLHSIFGMLVTYLLILLQFKPPEG
ncbi:gustatory receptor 8a-like [Diachasma alloeum]|uniref:Gustatory receptor n=1 Tax=Diachasma alloeum TaxID=454923 RepID=A0A4E0RZ45_9HYME|nr:gustatory receptor 8a-like [Diachasma alloeum]THK33171.1 gustatory receptor 26 [Diachasma alloeum]